MDFSLVDDGEFETKLRDFSPEKIDENKQYSRSAPKYKSKAKRTQ